eukprot:TRINITY_DN222_c0_g1_i16.p1 TRINITY_DN222_c0_g1~~TRINITY_DN222_c0_g1_i16.p1  ORF type:complete len:318 (-),score=103.70 TRINITY_DN222_c0_g1_i16:134-1087(-)
MIIECVKKAWDLGINYFDTAEIYGIPECSGDAIMGKALKALNVDRQDLVVSTKIWRNISQDDYLKNKVNRQGLSRKHIIEGLENSLKRLQLDYVDVVFAHRCDEEAPMEEICRAFSYLIEKGLAFYWGTSEWPVQKIMEAYAICDKLNLIKPICEQPQYNMLVRENFEENYGLLFDKYKMGSTIWSPLAGGLLTGKYNNGIPEGSRLTDELGSSFYKEIFFNQQEKQQKKLQELGKIAEELKISQATLALAWCLKNNDVSTAIIGATKPSQIEDNVNSLKVIKLLTPEIEARIENILDNRPKTAMDFKLWKPKPNRR